MKKRIKLGSPELDEPGTGSKAKLIPCFDQYLEKPDHNPCLIDNDSEHEMSNLMIQRKNLIGPKMMKQT